MAAETYDTTLTGSNSVSPDPPKSVQKNGPIWSRTLPLNTRASSSEISLKVCISKTDFVVSAPKSGFKLPGPL